jgi:hypothetical protein
MSYESPMFTSIWNCVEKGHWSNSAFYSSEAFGLPVADLSLLVIYYVVLLVAEVFCHKSNEITELLNGTGDQFLTSLD